MSFGVVAPYIRSFLEPLTTSRDILINGISSQLGSFTEGVLVVVGRMWGILLLGGGLMMNNTLVCHSSAAAVPATEDPAQTHIS